MPRNGELNSNANRVLIQKFSSWVNYAVITLDDKLFTCPQVPAQNSSQNFHTKVAIACFQDKVFVPAANYMVNARS
ncbi:MAG: hypothetical protein P8J29_00780, partial [Rhodospirillales bacterium]|nr:hypothetical protein [Rhodospirillales bacterium]